MGVLDVDGGRGQEADRPSFASASGKRFPELQQWFKVKTSVEAVS
jgi:hypothetical protein